MSGIQATDNSLGTERVGKLLRGFAIPGVISMVINSLYNMVDQIFIGQGVGMLGNGATNIIAPISTFAVAIASLFGDGLATYFSLQLGKGRPEKASKAVGNSIISGTTASVLLTVLVLVLLNPLCRLFGATDNIMPYALEYGRIIACGFPFVIVAVIINGVVRADGSPKFSMVSMMMGSILNVFLDPLFIFVFKMGVSGTALATIISQFINLVLNIAYLFRFKNIKLDKESFKFRFPFAGELASLGIASCLNTMASTIIAIVSNNMLTHYGALSVYGEDIPITVFGLCMKVSMLFFSVAMGISSASRPILGFNYGAEKFDRVKQTFRLTLISSTIVMTVDFLGQEYVNQSDAHKEDVSKNMEHYGSIRTIGASMCVLALSIENFPAYYQDYLRNIKLLSEQTIISAMRHLRAIVYYCQKQKWIEGYDITVRDIQPEIKQTFTKYELEKLGKKPRKDNFVEYRNWVMIQYLCATGNRISSMLALDVKDIEFDDNSIVVNVQKNRVPKRMPLQYSLKKILQEYVYYYRTDGETGTPMFNEPLFCNQFGERLAYTSARDSMHFYFDDRGVEWQGFHKFRHSYAANWIRDGGNPFMLREQLGHTSLAMTNRYANLYGMATRKEAEEHSLINQMPQKQGRSVIKKRK